MSSRLPAKFLHLPRRKFLDTTQKTSIDGLNMTDITKPVTRRSVAPHARFGRRILVTLGPGDVLGFRLEREKTTKYLPLEKLYDQADIQHAANVSGFDTSPCNNPKTRRNVR